MKPEARARIGEVMTIIGFCFLAIAVGKFMGMNIPMRGSVSDTALLAIACLLAR